MAGFSSLQLPNKKRKHCSENVGTLCFFEVICWLFMVLWFKYKMSPIGSYIGGSNLILKMLFGEVLGTLESGA